MANKIEEYIVSRAKTCDFYEEKFYELQDVVRQLAWLCEVGRDIDNKPFLRFENVYRESDRELFDFLCDAFDIGFDWTETTNDI